MAEMLASQPLSPYDLQNLDVLADAAVMMLNELQQQGQQKKVTVLADAAVTLLNGQQQSHLKEQGQQINVLADAAVASLNEQQQSRRKQQGQKKKTSVKKSSRKKKKTNVLADAAVTLLNEHQQSHRKQQGQKKKTNVKKSSRKKKQRPSPPAHLRVQQHQQQQRAPARWLLQQVAERGGMRPPAFLCSKRLTISDTNRNLNRFAIPRNVVYDVLYPLMNVDEQNQVCDTGEGVGGGGMRVQVHDGLGSSSLCFKFWQSNSMFLFNDGWKLVVERNGLRPEKDVIDIWCFRDASMALHFAFCVVREEEEGNVVVGEEEEGELKEEKENGVAADGAVSLEREAMNAANDDNIVSVVQKKEEKKNEEENKDCLRWSCKKRRTTYP